MASNKIAWVEGMLLSQQHLQQWDQQQLRKTWQLQQLQNPYCWGVIAIDIDESLLSAGIFHLNRCQLILPNGQYIQTNTNENAQLTWQLSHDDNSPISIYLAMPNNDFMNDITGYKEVNQPCAWQADYIVIKDCYDHKRERELIFAKPNLKIFNTKPQQQYVSIKIAEVINDNKKHFALNERYIPPIMQIKSSPELKKIIKKFLLLIENKVNDKERLTQIYSKLSYLLCNDYYHPNKLFEIIVELYGACNTDCYLTTENLPSYNHLEIYETLNQYYQLIIKAIEKLGKHGPVIFTLNKISDKRYEITDIDHQKLFHEQLYLAACKKNPSDNWIEHFVAHIKISSLSSIDDIIVAAVPGLAIKHVNALPSKISIKPNYEYFKLIPKGCHWKQIVKERNFAIVLSQEFDDIQLEIMTLRETQ